MVATSLAFHRLTTEAAKTQDCFKLGDTLKCITMKTATVRELRNNFAKLSRWIKDGQDVEITSRGVSLACLSPVKQSKAKKKIGFNAELRMKRLKEIYGGKVLRGNGVLLMREGSKW